MPLKRMLVGSRRIRSSKSNRLPRREVLEGITCLPYINPNAAEEREKRVTLLQSKNVSIKTIQFGWECRNKVFSIKWEEYCEGSCYLSFDGERREICIEISRPPDTIFISMRLSQLRFVSPHSYRANQISRLAHATSFRIANNSRRRFIALPFSDHERVAPYLSLAIRLIYGMQGDLRILCELIRIAHVQNIHDFEYPVVRRGIFSSANMNELHSWLSKLNCCVAFQEESLVRGLVVDIEEMLGLRANYTIRQRKEICILIPPPLCCLCKGLGAMKSPEIRQKPFSSASPERNGNMKSNPCLHP